MAKKRRSIFVRVQCLSTVQQDACVSSPLTLFCPKSLAASDILQVQKASEAIVTNEAVLHQGGSLGVNASVAWNCAGRNWPKFGKLSAPCTCFPSSVIIPVEKLCRVLLPIAAKHNEYMKEVWNEYLNEKGCRLYEWDENTQPFSSAVACHKRIPAPLKYIRVPSLVEWLPRFMREHNHHQMVPSQDQLHLEYGASLRAKKEEDAIEEMPLIEL
ncbi:hypothetical protein GPALN_012152 [Globodera pallida]|nr:hypothetical protein GPALN_012152 [Globodera pallida]